MSTLVSRVRFSVDDYRRMAETGIISTDQQVELLNGEIIEMTPIGAKHAYCVAELCGLFRDQLGEAYLVFPQNPIQIDDHSEPEPDIAVIDRSTISSREQLPQADDVLLLIEVADSTLAKDTQVKLPLYAKAGIVEVWIVDLTTDTINVYREPAGDSYGVHATVKRDQSVSPVSFPEMTITTEQVFGK